MGTKEKSKIKDASDPEIGGKYNLILHNDDHNSFEFVIECLIDICKHQPEQAEQCAFITHFKGKCDIKQGSFESLKPTKDELITRGLNVTID